MDSYAEEAEIFRTLEQLLLTPRGGIPRPVTVEQIENRPQCLLLKFRGIDSLEEARRLVGASLSMNSEDLEDTDEDEYYWFELIGLDAFDEDGKSLGAVENMIRTNAHDVLVVRNRSEEILVPAVSQYVRDVRIEEGRIVLRVPEQELP